MIPIQTSLWSGCNIGSLHSPWVGLGVMASHYLYKKSIYWTVIFMLLHSNTWLFVFPSLVWAMGNHHQQSFGRHWKVLGRFDAFWAWILNVNCGNESALLCTEWTFPKGWPNKRDSWNKWRLCAQSGSSIWKAILLAVWTDQCCWFENYSSCWGLDPDTFQVCLWHLLVDCVYYFDQFAHCHDEWHLSTNSGREMLSILYSIAIIQTNQKRASYGSFSEWKACLIRSPHYRAESTI